MSRLKLSNVFLIKLLTIIRLTAWYCAFLFCAVTRTLFIAQTWSNNVILILLCNLFFTLSNLLLYKHRHYYQHFKHLLMLCLSLLTVSTVIIYIFYMWNVYYRIIDLITINIMTNDRSESLLSTTFIHYQCCRIQEEILYDSVNERDYFLWFPFCQNAIVENEMRKDLWDNITTCAALFRSIVFYIRLVFLVDLLMNIFLLMFWLFHLDEIDHFECREDKSSSSSILPIHRRNQKFK